MISLLSGIAFADDPILLPPLNAQHAQVPAPLVFVDSTLDAHDEVDLRYLVLCVPPT